MSSLEDGMESILMNIDKNFDRVLESSSEILEQCIRDEVPVLSGLLQSDIKRRVNSIKRQAEVFDESDYSMRIEYGMKKTDSRGRTYNQAPNPFYRRGAEKAKPLISGVFRKEMDKNFTVRYRKVQA